MASHQPTTPDFIEPDTTAPVEPRMQNEVPTVMEEDELSISEPFLVTLVHTSMVKQDEILEYLANTNARLDSLTSAVNQFGGMLQHIVNTVSQAGQALSKGGIGGLMGLMGGKNDG